MTNKADRIYLMWCHFPNSGIFQIKISQHEVEEIVEEDSCPFEKATHKIAFSDKSFLYTYMSNKGVLEIYHPDVYQYPLQF